MKLLILACVLGLSAANLLQRAAPEIDRAVSEFQEAAAKAGSLSEALGIDEPWIEQAGNDINTELGKALRDSLNDLLEKIKEQIEAGKAVGQDLFDKVKDIKDKLKESGHDLGNRAKDLLEKIKEKAKGALKKILERLGLGKRNLDDQMDALARSKFAEFLEKIKEKILSDETIQKIRDYIRKITHDSELVNKLKELIKNLKNSEIREVLRNLFDHKSNKIAQGETWDKIKNFFKDLKIKIGDHTKKFGEWVKKSWGQGLEKLKTRYGTIRAIAMEFVAHAKDVSAEVAREALEFFRPYKDDLGTLWQQIKDAVKEGIGRF